MNKFLIICLLCAGFASRAQSSLQVNDPNAKEREITASFNAIKIGSGIQLFLSQGNEVALAVSAAEERFTERIKTEVENGVLRISFNGTGLPTKKYKGRQLKLYLSVKDLQQLSASAGATVKLVNNFKLKDFAVMLSSGAILDGNIEASSIRVDLNSGAVANVSGNVSKAKVIASSGAVLKAEGLHTDVCIAKASSGAIIKVAVKKELTAAANSGASISYYGDTAAVTKTISSAGVVKKAK